jgi:hypothetical protein
MSSLPPTLPTPSAITPALFDQLLSLYPSVLRLVYTAKVSSKKGKDVEKEVREFVELDRWRFDVLPAELATREEEVGAREEKLANNAMAMITERTGTLQRKTKEWNEDGKGGKSVKVSVTEVGSGWGLEMGEVERLVGWKL